MTKDTNQKFSSHLCEKCGGPAPDWKCTECEQSFHIFDARHTLVCPKGGKVRAKCQKCQQVETRCTC